VVCGASERLGVNRLGMRCVAEFVDTPSSKLSGMIHHASLPVVDLERSAALYDAALAALGYRRVLNALGFVGYGVEDGKDKLALKQTTQSEPAAPGFHLALAAPSREAVDAFYAAALLHGATDNGRPGLRAHYGPRYYAAFIIDLDGHRIEVVHNG